jgi:hypothetical protein
MPLSNDTIDSVLRHREVGGLRTYQHPSYVHTYITYIYICVHVRTYQNYVLTYFMYVMYVHIYIYEWVCVCAYVHYKHKICKYIRSGLLIHWFIYSFILSIRKFVSMTVGCRISHKHTKHTTNAKYTEVLNLECYEHLTYSIMDRLYT